LLPGDCVEWLKKMPDASIDSAVTDPPYELGFMGKKWDASGIAYSIELWREVLRVIKPGGHLLAFGGTRTYHRMACAIEDAGFEVRDSLHWIYGTGFPKSLNVGKAIDAAAGVEREVISRRETGWKGTLGGTSALGGLTAPDVRTVTAPATAAAAWNGWGTALKPAHEPIVLARKPLAGTVAANVLAHGTGALNIDASRIATEDDLNGGAYSASDRKNPFFKSLDGAAGEFSRPAGRWPANVLLDEDAAAGQDWAHFFYVAKPGRKERDLGCAHLPAKTAGEATDREEGTQGLENPRAGAGRTGGAKNYHPTVKPIQLMRYLVRLVTPPGGMVLDPFVGSGTTGIAALQEGMKFVGIERESEYLRIADARIKAAA
jgi:DNA modification methylase